MCIKYEVKHDVLDYVSEASKFKTAFGYELPEEYLTFLKENGTGLFPMPGYYDDLMEIGVFYAFSIDEKSDDEHNIVYVNKSLQANGRLTNNLLAFAETSDGHSLFCLVVDGELKGNILLLGDDNLLLNEGYMLSDINEKEDLIDQCFSDFLSKIK